MFGIEKDFQNLMEQVYGPLGEKKQMTKQTLPDTIEIDGVKYTKVVEEKPEQLKTLYQLFYENDWGALSCDAFCNIVKVWMSQYTHNVMTGEYLKGYEECMLVLEENLK